MADKLEQDVGRVPTAPGSHASEQWRAVPGYLGLYEVSDRGNIFDKKRLRFRALVPNGCGYLTVRLTKRGEQKRHSVHRLVCHAFHGKPRPGFQAAHLDGDRRNNAAENLRWTSPKENTSHKRIHGTHQAGDQHPRAKLTADDVESIREMLGQGLGCTDIGRRFGVHNTTIQDIKRGRKWRS